MVPRFIDIHILQAVICAQVDKFRLLQVLLLHGGCQKSLRRCRKDDICLFYKLPDIVIQAAALYQGKHVLVYRCICFINIASGAKPLDFHVPVPEQKPHQLCTGIPGCSNNACFYHTVSPLVCIFRKLIRLSCF